MKTLKETYEAPVVEIIEVEVEQGFASSNIGGSGDDMKQTSFYDDWE